MKKKIIIISIILTTILLFSCSSLVNKEDKMFTQNWTQEEESLVLNQTKVKEKFDSDGKVLEKETTQTTIENDKKTVSTEIETIENDTIEKKPDIINRIIIVFVILLCIGLMFLYVKLDLGRFFKWIKKK